MLKERVERKLETSGRVTPREVLEAYEETSLEPTWGEWFGGQQACALGALTLKSGFGQNVADFLARRITRGAWTYMMSFAAGFDNCPFLIEIDDPVAWHDGKRARHFVLARLCNAG